MFLSLFFSDDALSFIGLFILITVGLITFASGIWSENRYNGSLDYVKRNTRRFERAAKDALIKALCYVTSIPFQLMMFMGAVYLTRINSAWELPSLVMVFVVAILAIVYLVALPLWNFIYWFAVVMATTFNEYLKVRFPLEYAKSPKYNRRLE